MARFMFCLPRFHTNASPWIRILAGAGHHVTVHAVVQGPTENHSIIKPVILEGSLFSRLRQKFARTPPANGYFRSPSVAAYWRMMRAENPDLVIVRDVMRWFGRTAALCALLQGRKLVLYDQGDPAAKRFSGTWFRRNLFALAGVPHITTRLPKSSYAPGQGDAIPLPFGSILPVPASPMSAVERRAGPARLLMVAKYRDRKGHRQFIDALAALKVSCTFEATICGEVASSQDEAYRARLIEHVKILGLSDRIRFADNIANSAMVELYRSHDLFVLPSQDEPAAVSPIEAAWCGCAVLISADSGTRWYFPPGGLFDFPAGDAAAMADRIGRTILSRQTLDEARMQTYGYINKVANDQLVLSKFMALVG